MVLISLLVCGRAKAQFSVGDLFNQASKQKTYYLQQIVAYEAFESELKQGYNVMKHGLTGIAEINTAELNAHTAYYQSLKQPSAAVQHNTQVQDILQWESEIVSSFGQNYPGLTASEQIYFGVVQSNLLQGCNADLTDMQNLLQAGRLQLTDDQRLARLDKIHADMQDKYQFSQSFCNSLRLLVAQRQQNSNDLQTLNSLYETN